MGPMGPVSHQHKIGIINRLPQIVISNATRSLHNTTSIPLSNISPLLTKRPRSKVWHRGLSEAYAPVEDNDDRQRARGLSHPYHCRRSQNSRYEHSMKHLRSRTRNRRRSTHPVHCSEHRKSTHFHGWVSACHGALFSSLLILHS